MEIHPVPIERTLILNFKTPKHSCLKHVISLQWQWNDLRNINTMDIYLVSIEQK